MLDSTEVPENHGADFVVTSKTNTIFIGTHILTRETQLGLERAAVDANRFLAKRMPRLMPIVNNWQAVRLD
jgi:hypothetical protein